MARTRKKKSAPKGSTRHKGDILKAIIEEMHKVPNAKTERNVFLPTPDGREREFDILVTSSVAGFPVRIAIDARMKKKPQGLEK